MLASRSTTMVLLWLSMQRTACIVSCFRSGLIWFIVTRPFCVRIVSVFADSGLFTARGEFSLTTLFAGTSTHECSGSVDVLTPIEHGAREGRGNIWMELGAK